MFAPGDKVICVNALAAPYVLRDGQVFRLQVGQTYIVETVISKTPNHHDGKYVTLVGIEPVFFASRFQLLEQPDNQPKHNQTAGRG